MNCSLMNLDLTVADRTAKRLIKGHAICYYLLLRLRALSEGRGTDIHESS